MVYYKRQWTSETRQHFSMKVSLCFLLAVLCNSTYYYYRVNAQLRTNFFLKRIEQCDPKTNYAINYNFSFWTVKQIQYMTVFAVYQIDLDNTVQTTTTVEMLPGGNISVYLFTIRERKGCDAIHKYMGEFSYDIERAAGLIPGMCPIRKGRYNVHNLPLHFEKISLQTFPFGNLRLTFNGTDNKNNVLTCVKLEVENRQ